MTEPETREPLLARFRALLDGPWAAPAIIELVDAWAGQISDAARRDERKWAAAYADHFGFRVDVTSFDQEVDYLRDWIVARHDVVRNTYLEQPIGLALLATTDESASPGAWAPLSLHQPTRTVPVCATP